MATHNFINLNR